MGPLVQGLLIVATLIGLLAIEVPVAFALMGTAILFLVVAEGPRSLVVVADTLFGALNEITLMSIPLFILMGAAVAFSRAGSDLYTALDRWLSRVPGGLLLSNIGACTVFAALSGSSPS